MVRLGMTASHSISSHIVGIMVHVVQANTDTSHMLILILIPSHYHTQEIHYNHQHQYQYQYQHRYHHHRTPSLHAPVRVCSAGIEAAIAMHASPSFCIAVTDDDTCDGADVDSAIEGLLGWPVGCPVG